MSVSVRAVNHVQCSFCGETPPKISACSKCKEAFYCNVTCQKNHWKAHKSLCGRVTHNPPTAAADHKEQNPVKELTQKWLAELEPISNKHLRKARSHALKLFARIVHSRKKTMQHGNDPTKWGGFFYRHEVSPAFKAGRVPEKYQALYATALVKEEHAKVFEGLQRKIEAAEDRPLNDYLDGVFNGIPTIVDCGAIASLLQLWTYDLFYPQDQILGSLIGYPPKNMFEIVFGMRTVFQQRRNITPFNSEFHLHRPNKVNWLSLKEPRINFELKPLDLCYIKADTRYDNYPTSSQGSAFESNDYQGAGNGWWITHIGKSNTGEDLYLGFGGDDGPMTLDQWKARLREEFIEKWGEIPADWNCTADFYLSPFREKWP